MANVAAVASASDKELKQLTETARGLGATTAFTASQAAEAMMALAQAGQSTAEIYQTTGDVLLFAGAAQTSMADSAETLVATLAMFNLAADQSNRVVNVFAAGMASSLLNAERLREGLAQVGSTASATGMRLEETVAALGLLNNAGMLGGIAGTRLKNVLVRLAAPNKILASLLGDNALEAYGLAGAMEKLKDADAGAIFRAFGRIAAPAVLVMRRATEEMKDLEAQITDTNKAQEMFDTQMNTVSSQFKIFKSQLQENMIATFTALRNESFNAIGSMTDMLKKLKPYIVGVVVKSLEWIRANRELLANILKVGGAVAAAAAIIAFLTSGIGLVTVAVIAGVTIWTKWGDKIKEVLGRAIDFAKGFLESHETAISAVIGFFKGWINVLIGGIVFLALNFKDLGLLIIKALKKPFDFLREKFQQLIDFAGPILSKVGLKINEFFDNLKGDTEKTLEEQEGIFGRVGGKIAENARVAFGTDYAGAMVSGVTKGVDAAKKKLGELAGKTKETVAGVVADIKATGAAAGGAVVSPRARTGGDTPAELERQAQERLRVATKEGMDEFKIELKADQAREASLIKSIAREGHHTAAWLSAKTEMIKRSYEHDIVMASDNAAQKMALQMDQEAEIAEARMEFENAVLENFLGNNEVMLLAVGSLGAAYDTFFAGVAMGETKLSKLREASLKAFKASFIRNTADMIKYQLKQFFAGLLISRAAKDADEKKDRFASAKMGGIKAYQAYASIPIIGPMLGAAAAAAAFAFLMAFQKGGLVPGVGSVGRDTVPAVLEPREFVIQRSSVAAIGERNLEYINRTGSLPAARGGPTSVEITIPVTERSRSIDEMVEYMEEEVVPVLQDILERGHGL
jgi:TP901 family phage tail tape measure protein